MKSPVLAMLALTLAVGSMSCSTDASNGTGGGGTSGVGSSQGGSSASGSQSAAGGSSSSSKSNGGNSGSAGSSAGGQKSSSGGTTGGSSASGGQSATGGKTGTGGGKAGGETGTAGATSSAAGGTITGGTSAPGGTTATGGQSMGGRTTGPMTGGSSAGGATTGGAGGGSASGGSSGTDTGPKGGAASSPGCGKSPTMANGAGKIGSRNFMLRIPTGYDNKHPYPLVFAFHWQGGTMGDVDGGGSSGYTWSYYGLREKADNSTDHKMIFVAPDGNGGWPNSGGADLKFVDDLYKQITQDLCVDTSRVFTMGFSYGGGMTYELACVRAKPDPTGEKPSFRAAAVYAGAQLSGKCDGGKDPIAYIGFHSVSDNKCSYGGGEGLRDTFVSNNGCTKQTPPKPSGMTHVCTKYTGCKAGYPVEWCAFDGAGHSPAPVDGQSNDSGGGDKTWTKAEAWAFFTQF